MHQSKSLEDREIGQQHAPLWRVLAEQLKILFPDGDGEGAFIVPALDARSRVLSIKDRRNGVFTLSWKWTAALVAPDLCVPGTPDGVLQRILSQTNTANV